MRQFHSCQCKDCGTVCEKIFLGKKRVVLTCDEPFAMIPDKNGRDFGYTGDGRFVRGKFINRNFLTPGQEYCDVFKPHRCLATAQNRARTFFR